MVFDHQVESAIREAMARGEFDNLPGAGKPVDLRAYFETPEGLRLAQSIMVGAGVLPPEVQLMQEIARLKQELAATRDPEGRVPISTKLHESQMKLNLLMESLRVKGRGA